MRPPVVLWLATATLIAPAAVGCHRSSAAVPASPRSEAGVSQDSIRRATRTRDSLEQAEADRRRAQAIADSIRRAGEARNAASDEARRRLTSSIYFDFDQSDITPDGRVLLEQQAALLAANPRIRIRIDGNTDERGSDEYNLALGNRRAAAAKRYLESKGVDGGRMEVVSYGEERPLNPGSDENAYAQNRRDEFEVTAGGDNLVAPQ
jgi:peptidoglycan-associated lipoprotein